jgi:transcriptional regulator NrdR family protein
MARDVELAFLTAGKSRVSSEDVREALLERLREFKPEAYDRFAALGRGKSVHNAPSGQYRLFADSGSTAVRDEEN